MVIKTEAQSHSGCTAKDTPVLLDCNNYGLSLSNLMLFLYSMSILVLYLVRSFVTSTQTDTQLLVKETII